MERMGPKVGTAPIIEGVVFLPPVNIYFTSANLFLTRKIHILTLFDVLNSDMMLKCVKNVKKRYQKPTPHCINTPKKNHACEENEAYNVALLNNKLCGYSFDFRRYENDVIIPKHKKNGE